MKKIVLLLLIAVPIHAEFKTADNNYKTTAFYSQGDSTGWKVAIKGKVLSYSEKSEIEKDDLLGRAMDKSKALVRLYNKDGVKEGDTLYIINSNNLVVGKLLVRSIAKSEMGYLLVGYGNFRLSSIDDRVVQRIEDENSKYAYIYKSRGDYFFNSGESGKAINEYKKSIEYDRGNPEAHLSLGTIYMDQKLFQFAFREFLESYKNISRLYDNDDKYRLLKSMAEIKFNEAYGSYSKSKLRREFINDGIRYSKEALLIYPDSVEMNYLLGIFYYKNENPSDRDARDQFSKVLEKNPDHVDTLVAMSELYFRHKNSGKSRTYAERALKADPFNQRAREMIKYIELEKK